MLIEFSRTGGFCGTRLEASVDTDMLPPDEATKIIGHLASLRPERGQRPAAGTKPAGPDRFSYTVKVTRTVGADKMSSTFKFGEGKHPDLVAVLTDLAKAPA